MGMLPTHRLALSTLVVRDYDEAIRFFVDTIGFTLIVDNQLEHGKRWSSYRHRIPINLDFCLLEQTTCYSKNVSEIKRADVLLSF